MIRRLFSKPSNQPWPRCGACFRRTDPADMCVHHTHVVDTCIWDCLYAGNHPPTTETELDQLPELEELS